MSTNRLAVLPHGAFLIAITVLLTIAGCGQTDSATAIVVEKHAEPAAWIFVPMERSCGKSCTTTEAVPMYYPDSYEVTVSIKDGTGRDQERVYWVSRSEFQAAQIGRLLDCVQHGTCSDTRAPATSGERPAPDTSAAGN